MTVAEHVQAKMKCIGSIAGDGIHYLPSQCSPFSQLNARDTLQAVGRRDTNLRSTELKQEIVDSHSGLENGQNVDNRWRYRCMCVLAGTSSPPLSCTAGFASHDLETWYP